MRTEAGSRLAREFELHAVSRLEVRGDQPGQAYSESRHEMRCTGDGSKPGIARWNWAKIPEDWWLAQVVLGSHGTARLPLSKKPKSEISSCELSVR